MESTHTELHKFKDKKEYRTLPHLRTRNEGSIRKGYLESSLTIPTAKRLGEDARREKGETTPVSKDDETDNASMHWYMVSTTFLQLEKAGKKDDCGCGRYLGPSLARKAMKSYSAW